MHLNANWLADRHLQDVMALLEDAGFHPFFVGGCVRNAILGYEPGDIDIASDAQPDKVMSIFQAAGLKAIGTGLKHGTVTVVSDSQVVEITTFRRDVATDGRHAEVAFSTRIEEDAARRDFTMNALYADRSGEVVDPLGQGLDDLERRRLRFIGSAGERIREDCLRILRFFRFHAWYARDEDGFNPESIAAIGENLDGLARLSKERIGHEIRRLLDAPDPSFALAGMVQIGVLASILPGSDDGSVGRLVHLADELGLSATRITRLAALGGVNAVECLRLSRNEAKQISTLRDAASSPMRAAELGYRLGSEMAGQALLLRAALGLSQPLQSEFSDASAASNAAFPIQAKDLEDDFSGKALGEKLRELETRWIASDFALSREQLLKA